MDPDWDSAELDPILEKKKIGSKPKASENLDPRILKLRPDPTEDPDPQHRPNIFPFNFNIYVVSKT